MNKSSNIKAVFKYAWLTVKHKAFVFRVGFRTGASIRRLLLHDISKFRPSELFHYARQFYGDASDPEGFIQSWTKHQNRNPHHWEYWIPRTGHNRCDPPYPDNEPIPMPMWAVREMLADWLGASRAYEGKWPDMGNWTWYEGAKGKMRLHPITQARINQVMVELLSEGDCKDE